MSDAKIQIQGGGPVLPVEGYATDASPQAQSYTLLMDAGLAARIVTLPPSTSFPGRIYIIKKTDVTANTVTVTASGTDLIDGAATAVLVNARASITIQSDGEGLWSILSVYLFP